MRKQGHGERYTGNAMNNARWQVHAGEEDHARPGWIHQDVDRTPRGRMTQESRTEINGVRRNFLILCA